MEALTAGGIIIKKKINNHNYDYYRMFDLHILSSSVARSLSCLDYEDNDDYYDRYYIIVLICMKLIHFSCLNKKFD